VAELVEEVSWPPSRVDVGLVESAGGVRSPQTHDGDAVALMRALAPDVVLLVADAGLGTINAVRLSAGAVADGADVGAAGAGAGGMQIVVALNRFDGHNDLHERNRRWLADRDNMCVVTVPGEEKELADLVRGR
jgi:dethiobiotin synthetase